MANTIEIRVKASDDTGPVYDKVKAESALEGRDSGAAFTSAFATHLRGEGGSDISQALTASLAGGAGSAHVGGGEQIGEDLVDSIADTVGRDLGPKLEDPIKGSGSSAASAFTSAFQGDLEQGLSSSALSGFGRSRGEEFSVSFGQGAKDSIQDANLAGIIGDALDDGLDDAAAEAWTPRSRSGKILQDNARETGEAAGKEAGEGMSPLLVSAMAGAAAIGAPALLAGMGAAFVGVTALALKSNVVIAADYQKLGKEASSALTQAAAPAAGTLHQALVGVEATVASLTPELQGLFANAEPDITAVASGVDAFAQGILPGMSAAVKGSQVIVQDFGASMGPLGQNVGGFFQGLTRDAYTTGSGLQSLLGTVGHLASTLGGVLGSAATAGSTALMGLDPVINTTLSLVQRIASPGVVGAGGGLLAAFKLDPAISSGLQSASNGFTSLAAKAEGATGMLGAVGGASEKMAGGLGTAADVMGGPWGMAIGAGIGLATGLAGTLINAAKASDALTLSQQGLDQAVQQDNGHVGNAITTYVAAQAQTDGLAQSATNAGVSLSTWTQAVVGNKAAQQEVTAAVLTANQVVQNQAKVTSDAGGATGKYSQDLQDAQKSASDGAAANNTLTDKNKQLLASMQAQSQQIAQAIDKQAQLTAATNTLTNATNIFQSSLKAQYQTQVTSEQQTALASVASLNLGNANTALSQKLYQTEIAYQGVTAASSAYNTQLTALNGTQMSLDQAQNALDEQMVTARQTFSANGASIQGNTSASVANRQALVTAAQAIEALGVAQVQATGSINKGNATIQQQINAFVNSTGATGKARLAIIAYLEQITKIPPNVSTTFKANTSEAYSSINQLQNEIDKLSGSYTYAVNTAAGQKNALMYSLSHKVMGGNVGAAATGGARGAMTMVGEQGPELVNLPYGSSVSSNASTQSMMQSGGAIGVSGSPAVDVQFSGDLDGAFATYFMNLVRTGRIQIKQRAIVA